jgi:hypothetical protein
MDDDNWRGIYRQPLPLKLRRHLPFALAGGSAGAQ